MRSTRRCPTPALAPPGSMALALLLGSVVCGVASFHALHQSLVAQRRRAIGWFLVLSFLGVSLAAAMPAAFSVALGMILRHGLA